MTDMILGEWVMRRGDRLPMFSVVIEDDEGQPVNLTGGRAHLQIRPEDGAPPLDLPAGYPVPPYVNGWLVLDAFIYDAPNGLVTYDWPSFQTAGLTVGVSELVVSVDFPDGTHLTAPSDRSARLVVRPAVLPPIFT
jgi:hypothetical protein